MKRLLKLLILLVALVVAAAIGLTLFLDKGIKRAVEMVGPRLTQVDVRLERVSLSLLSGRVELEGLFIGNPGGYQSESAIELGSLVLAAEPRSFISDKVVIRTLSLNAPVVTFEGGLKDNNLRQILDSVHTATERLRSGDRPKDQADEDAQQKLQVDELIVTGGKVQVWMNLLGGRATAIDLPEIRLTNLGTGPEGITTAELTDRLLRIIIEKATVAAAGALAGSGDGGVDRLKRAGREAVDKALDEAARSATDLLKR
ncbi:MAG: hypothetical protein KJ072_14250 [Verrucomicrobia bacterium]|nr:hypothetical protein [Verrucomicrobiota bacterium]